MHIRSMPSRSSRAHHVVAFLALASALGLAACGTNRSLDTDRGAEKAQLFEGMGPHRRPVSTDSTEAQAYFDQGLTWAYAFNHDEAIRSFEKAATLDPDLAMAWWGVALCCGPHINNPIMTEARSALAWKAVGEAKARAGRVTPVELALIDAVATRYAWPAPADRTALNTAYAEAMRSVHERFPEDRDVSVLYAESLMDLQPWDLWTPEGSPKGQTETIVALLESALARDPDHPGAAHLLIHAVEAAQPARARAAAETLRTLVPASGHLTHMPSHIDVRIGAWEASAAANRKAIAADAAYRELSPRQNFYRLYMLHNQQFLSFTCMMLGRSEEAIAAGKASVTGPPAEWIKENAAIADGYQTVHMDALKRFGRWDEILALPSPPEHLPYATSMWRFNRAVAFAAKGQVTEAEAERVRFEEAVGLVPEAQLAQINPARRVLGIARHMLDAEIAYARRDYDTAVRELRAAVAIEDSLLYMEPPDWMQPVRHTLGVVLLDAGRPAEAEAVYREDLIRWPENGWSLLGLSQALEKQGQTSAAADARRRHEVVWRSSDIAPHATCLCAPKTTQIAGVLQSTR